VAARVLVHDCLGTDLSMFIILLNYIKPLCDVEPLIDEHRRFLARHYAAGNFLLSGRKEPRTGGVILASAPTRAAVEQIIRHDPFHRERVAEYEIIEFVPTLAAPQFESLRIAA
jgi:uncharacterized protein YciI